MTQIDVALTDYGLALECGSFGYVLFTHRHQFSLATWYAIFFLSICAATLAGGTVHGFFVDESSMGYGFLWPFTLIAIGVTAFAGIRIAAGFEFQARAINTITAIAAVLLIVYCFVILRIRRDFLVAIIGYLPALLSLGFVFVRAYRHYKKSGFLLGFLGICTMLLAAAAQQAKIGIHPQYFNYNAVYHVLQAAGLYMVYRAARESGNLRGILS